MEIKSQNITTELSMKNVEATRRHIAVVGYTSTPRKSKVHFDQRRLLDQMIKDVPSPPPLAIEGKFIFTETNVTPPDASLRETPLTTLNRREVSKGCVPKEKPKRLETIAEILERCRRNSSLFGRRVSRHTQAIDASTSIESVSTSLLGMVAVKRKSKAQIVVGRSEGSSEGAITSTSSQKLLPKKSQKEKGSRPLIYLRENIFAKHRTLKQGSFSYLYRQKSREERMDRFNNFRNIKSFKLHGNSDEVDVSISSDTEKDVSFDLEGLSDATHNSNNFIRGISVHEKCIPSRKDLVAGTFVFGQYQLQQLHCNKEANDLKNDNCAAARNDKHASSKYDFFLKEKLVTSQDLENFDRFVANCSKNKDMEDSPPFDSCKHFENILVATSSNAPFAVKDLQLNSKDWDSNFHHSLCSNHSFQSSRSGTYPQNDCDHTSLRPATPHISSLSTVCCLSRTIYGGTVIYNNRLPNINTTYVRKSSLYMKNQNRASHRNMDLSSCIDVVLITNQTITFADMIRMWSQMDSFTRIIVSFAVLASFTSILGLFISLCSRR